MVAPDGTPGDAEGIHVIRQLGIGLRLISHGQVAGNGDQIRLDPIHQGAYRMVKHGVGMVKAWICGIVVTFVQLHIRQIQNGEEISFHFKGEHPDPS